MSSPLVIASVTAILKHLLENELIQQSVNTYIGDVHVSVLPPDRVPTGSDEQAQLNLYLYRMTPNSSWRRAAGDTGQTKPTTRSGLAFDLHYLLTAYGGQAYQAEILLGHAIQILYETPLLTTETMRSALTSLASSHGGSIPHPLLDALASSSLLDQQEALNIRAEFLGTEEMSRLWSALQARYRPSATYQVSAVVIEDRRSAKSTDKAKVMIS